MMCIALLTIVLAGLIPISSGITIYSQKGCEPICSCYMDGIFYDHGDKFHRKGHPCITYECKDGLYVPIYAGCEYKDECKAVGSNWTEGCFRYTCNLVFDIPTYKMIEGGCRDQYGNCIPVGQKINEDCHLQECQIHGSCYKLTTVSKGCRFGGECKAVHSFWHNGCTIFECVEEYERIDYRTVEDEIMYWPDGDYSLIMTKDGCPIDLAEKWGKSHVIHYGDGSNYVSDPFNLFGNYTEEYFDHHFCTHINLTGSNLNFIPRYQTYWDAGRYCILRRKGKCPKGFESGSVRFDDADGKENLISSGGELPDGDFIMDITIYFCCRYDGHLDEPIILPKDRPFALFMAKGEDDCQTVRGMTVTKELFAFDDANVYNRRKYDGSLPEIKDDDNNTLIYFCYYKPLECGCTAEDGNVIEIGQNFTKDCVLYRCEKVQNMRYMVVVEGACNVNGKCVKENAVWTENSGETCYVKTCRRIVDTSDSSDVRFEPSIVYKGCKDDDQCAKVGYEKNRGCYVMQCSLYRRSKEPYFKLKRAGCSDGKGGCIPLGQEFKRKCMTYRCRREPTSCELEFLSGGCGYGGKCHDVNTTWDIGCTTVKCSMEKKNYSYLLRVEAVTQRCSFRDKCYEIGENETVDCNTYSCVADNKTKSTRMAIIKGGCKIGNDCKAPNETWQSSCTRYICKWVETNNNYYFRKDIDSMGCNWKQKCFQPGEIGSSHCVDFKCIYRRTVKGHTAYMEQFNSGCKDTDSNGTTICVSLGEIKERDCVTSKCEKAKGPYPYFKPISAGCKVDGVCKDLKTIWTDKKSCNDYQCLQKPGYSRPYPMKVKSGCKIKDSCKATNESLVEGCYTFTCSRISRNGHEYSRVKKSLNGCMDKGTCFPIGSPKNRSCFRYECLQKEGKMYPKFELVSAGCMGRDNKCHDVNEDWTYKSTKYSSCVKYRCTKTGRSYRNIAKKHACLDANGICRESGEKGFPVNIGSRRMNNCNCLPSNNNRVRLKCYG